MRVTGMVGDWGFTMSKKTTSEAGHFHAVKFYETPESLCRIVAEFLGEGLMAQQPALVLATPEHREGILAALRARHVDVDGAQASGDLLLLDASQTLGSFMRDGMPNAELFKRTATSALEALCRDRKDCHDPRVRRTGGRAVEGRTRCRGDSFGDVVECARGHPRFLVAVWLRNGFVLQGFGSVCHPAPALPHRVARRRHGVGCSFLAPAVPALAVTL